MNLPLRASLFLLVTAAGCSSQRSSVLSGEPGLHCVPSHTAAANGLQLEYDTFGDPKDPPVLLVMGLGTQMTAWDPELCKALAAKGFYVVRFDNRDVGLSSKLESAGPPALVSAAIDIKQGRAVRAPYRISHMAADAVGLLDALKLPAAHVVGASMGGMIAQQMAIDYPARVLSLTSIMSTTGDPSLPKPSDEVLSLLLKTSVDDRQQYQDRVVDLYKVIGSHSADLPFDEARVRSRSAASFDRCSYLDGRGRQLLAVLASGSRKEQLASVHAPTLVIHGEADGLVPLAAGRATAAAIPGARLITIPGMGHDLHPGVWSRIIDAVAANAARATAPQANR